MPVNKELLLECLRKIETFPELWDQQRFITKSDCGTSHCLGGWALTFAVGEPVYHSCKYAPELCIPDYDASPPKWRNAWDSARDILGLTDYEADVLFAGDNSLEDLEKYVAELIHENYETDTLNGGPEEYIEEEDSCACCRDYPQDDEDDEEEEE